MVTIVDAGPLVAYLSPRDEWHDWSKAALKASPGPLHRCEPVLTEVCFLLDRNGIAPADLFRKLRTGAIVLAFILEDELSPVDDLMARYASTPMSLADACLVRMSERHRECRVLTLDRDFHIYRRLGRSAIPMLSPWS